LNGLAASTELLVSELVTPGSRVLISARNGPERCPRIGGQACTGSTFAGRCGKLGEPQFP
jgi:hypothetical protein